MDENKENKKSCHKCIHYSVCELYKVLEKFDKYFEHYNFWVFANICVRYKRGRSK